MSVTFQNHEDYFDRNFSELAMDKMQSTPAYHKRIAKTITTQDWTTKFGGTSGLSPAEETGVYAGAIEDTPIQDYSVNATQVKWSKKVVIPEAVAIFANSKEDIVNRFRDQGEDSTLAKSFHDRKDLDIAYYMSNAATSTIAATPDGAALASTSHPINSAQSTTYNSNLLTSTALSYAGVESMMETIGECSDNRNNPAMLLASNPAYLCVPTQLSGLAIRIAQTLGQANSRQGTMDNDKNALPALGLQQEVISWPRLGDKYQGVNDTDWYIIMPGLTFWIVEGTALMHRAWVNNDTGALHFNMWQYWKIIIKDFRGIWKGAA